MRRASERGVSLTEVLVAITVLALALSIAFVLYDGARRSFKVGNNLVEQQQVVRIALDKLSRDLAMAGFNHNPDGTTTRPDEAIEAAYATAIVIRADFDAKDPALRDTPEVSLAGVGVGGAFLSVSTGNDEIVGYVLAKPDGSSPGTIDFEADVVGVPRDGIVEPLSVASVAAVQDDPPYTLYRITIEDDAASAQRVPLVDNVRSLRFRYYDGSGAELGPPGGAEDEISRDARAAIRRIGVEIEGLTREPDLRWRDPDDADPDTRDFHKFALFGDVTLPNLGLFGIKDLEASLSPPSTPPPPQLYPGHCGGLYVKWAPNPPQDEVARYELRYGTDPGALAGPRYAATSSAYLGGLNDATTYYLTVQAVDDSGNVSAPSQTASAPTANLNRPETPENLAASQNLSGVVTVTWDAVLDNVTPTSPSADPAYPRMRDFAGYRICRGSNATLAAYPANEIASQPGVIFEDTQVVNCEPYFYTVSAVDACGLPSPPSEAVRGQTYTATVPEAPQSVQAYPVAGGVRLIWDPVRVDVNGQPVWIEDYKIYKATGIYGATFAPYAFISGTTQWVDIVPYNPAVPVAYKVQAYDACPNYSALSTPASPDCQFVGDVQIAKPPGHVHVGDPIVVQLNGGSGVYDLTLRFEQSGIPLLVVSVGSGPPWPTSSWPGSLGPGGYRLRATVTQSDGCEQTRSRWVWVEND